MHPDIGRQGGRHVRQHLIDLLTEGDDVVTWLHLEVEQQAVAYPALGKALDIFLRLGITPLDGGYVLEADGLSGNRVGQDDLLAQLVLGLERHIHMDECCAHVVGYLAGHGAETLRGEARHDQVLVDGVAGDALHIQRHGYLLVLLTEQFDAAHLLDLAQAVAHHVGVILQFAGRTLVALQRQQDATGVAEVVNHRHSQQA